MRTPVVLVTGQGDSDRVAGTLMGTPGTLVVGHEYDGQVVRRWVSMMRDGELSTSEWPLELTNGCVCCTTRNDLLVLLRRLHRRDDVTRIVVLLAPWSEPEPVCVAINEVPVHVGHGYIDGPAGRDVRIDAVVATVDSDDWLHQAVGSDQLDDGRTVAQVVVGQAEFADLLVLNQPDATTLSVLRRLAPLARITVGVDRVEQALAHLDPHTRRGRRRDPHDPLLAGQPPLDTAGEVTLMEFTARRPFHPQRLHAAIDMLLDGVVRTRGRAFVANRLDDVMWIESAGGGVLVENAGTWLAAMEPNELARTDPERRALAAMGWDDRFGDRHISMAVLVCGAQPDEIDSALRGALLTDHELALPSEWSQYPDPFGDWHADPCDELPDIRDELTARPNHHRDEER
jgi:G3E family GTPase